MPYQHEQLKFFKNKKNRKFILKQIKSTHLENQQNKRIQTHKKNLKALNFN